MSSIRAKKRVKLMQKELATKGCGRSRLCHGSHELVGFELLRQVLCAGTRGRGIITYT